MADLDVVEAIKRTVTIPVMAKCRIGHFIEARALEAIEIDFIDESEVLTPADEKYHVDKWDFKVPFVCGCRNLGEALRRISEGAAMIRTKGEAGTGDVSQAVKHLREITSVMKSLTVMSPEELYGVAKEYRVSIELVKIVAKLGKLPVPNFAAGGIATPADAALCMHLGAEAVFVGSGIFKSDDPEKRAKAIVSATTHWQDYAIIAEQSHGLGGAMKGISADTIPKEEQLQTR
jgi:pyridoxal 5'-phosphate synthase pdxS subunit